jgi:predicted metallo-beta-lactamase superfamily hydrolase
MATYVECGDLRVLVDPGATVGMRRGAPPPGEEEWEALRRANDRISGYAVRADVVFVSHYHHDHFRYDPALYAGRTVWAKDPQRMAGGPQPQRGAGVWQVLASRCRLDAAEGRRLETAECVLVASPPLPHGLDGTPLGTVVALTVIDRRTNARFVHASDVLGPLSPVAAAYIERERPSLLYLSGPPIAEEARLGRAVVETAIDHLLRIVDRTGCRVILDHYALRDVRYRERLDRLWATGHVVTAAGYLGLADTPLEARRLAPAAARRKPPAPVPAGRLNRAGWPRTMAPRWTGRARGERTG